MPHSAVPPSALTLIHTSPVLTPLFSGLCRQHLPGVAITHMVDESLIKDTIARGALRRLTIRRLISMIESAEAAGAEAVLVTCSSIGRGVDLAKPLFDMPVIRVDEAMAERAVTLGRRIGVAATLSTTLGPTVELIRRKAAEAGRAVEIEEGLCAGAFDAVLAGDTATHDRLLSATLLDLARRTDVIVLAQASMARVVEALPPDPSRPPIVASPELGVLRMKQVLENIGSDNVERSRDASA